MSPDPARPTAIEATLTLLERLRQTHDAGQQLAIATEIRALAPAVIVEWDAERTRILTENTALREALTRLVDATLDDGNTEVATAAHLHAQGILAAYPPPPAGARG